MLFIMADDIGIGDFSCYGAELISTPTIDKFAAENVQFMNAYTACSVSSPTRFSILTGCSPYRNDYSYSLASFSPAELAINPEVMSMGTMFKSKGYATAAIGKWHLGWLSPDDTGDRGMYSPPWQHGFDETFVTRSAVPTWDPTKTPDNFNGWGNKAGGPWNGSFYMTNGVRETENLDGDDSRVIMDRVIPFIEQAVKDGKPFMSCVWFHAPHEPVVAGPDYLEMYKDIDNETKRHYYGCITAMDDQVGRLRAKLKELGIDENTIIFFSSDNGPADPLVKKKAASAGEYRGHKHTMYDGGLRVPSMAVWPSNIKAGTVVDTHAASYDYLPTIVDLAGLKFNKKPAYKIDGVSMAPAINGQQVKRDTTMFLAWMRIYKDINARALVGERYKIVYPEHATEPELYDLKNDPYEKNNIIDKEPKIAKQMLEELEAWEKSCQISRDGGDYSSY